jgi:hypothetical protein
MLAFLSFLTKSEGIFVCRVWECSPTICSHAGKEAPFWDNTKVSLHYLDIVAPGSVSTVTFASVVYLQTSEVWSCPCDVTF